jgi:lipopolysaccharide biosynthesis regulator YciM
LRYFLRPVGALILVVGALKVVGAAGDLYPAAENTVASSPLEQALYRLMDLPAGPILARRPPSESRPQLDSLIPQSAEKGELYAIHAQEDERQLDFSAAEEAWKQSAELSKDTRAALLNLADFYHRRLEPQREAQVLVQAANLPSDSYQNVSEQASWKTFRRALEVASDNRLPAAVRDSIYQSWVGRYPKESQPLEEYFHALIADGNREAARRAAGGIQAAFPQNLSLRLDTESQLAQIDQGASAALSVYGKEFSVLWPEDLRKRYYVLLTQAHQLRVFQADALRSAAADPAALEPRTRLFFYYEQQGKRGLADRQLLDLRARRATAIIVWTADELKTLGALFLRVADYEEAAHADYSLYTLPSVTAADKAFAMASLIDLLLDVPEQPLQFGARDLSIYRNIATLDRHPGFLNGILSLVLNTTFPGDQYQTASQTSVAYFHRAMASQLIERMKREFPGSGLTAPREAKLFMSYAVYGQYDALVRLCPAWMATHKNAGDYTRVALLLADGYAQTKQTARELALYDGLLQTLGESSGHHPLGEEQAYSPDYAHVLDHYISRLTQLGRLPDAVALYRHEIDRNPNDPGIYQRLALFVEQNHLDNDLEATYRAAMKRFDGNSWPDKLARFYLRNRQTAAYQSLAKEVTGKFDGSRLAAFVSAAQPDRTFSITLYRQVNLYAHQRFPHNLTFVRNLLASYQTRGFVDAAAYERLLRENWFYDLGLRTSFFEYLSRTNKLSAELAAVQAQNLAAQCFFAEGKAWLGDYESAAPVFVALADAAPGDKESVTRAISVERSVGEVDSAIRLAERKANAAPADADAAILVGEIYADKDMFAKAAPWWNKVATMRPGVANGYLESATVFWDYFQYTDALRMLANARRIASQPALYAYQAGVIHENQNDFSAAIEEYMEGTLSAPAAVKQEDEAESAGGDDLSQNRLIQLATRPQTAAEIERRTAALADTKPFSPAAFRLRMALLENQERNSDIRALLIASLENISEVEQVQAIRTNSERLRFDDVTVAALQRTVALSSDPVEKLASRLSLARFYESHQDLARAESEFAALLAENPNLLGIVRANTDFFWNEKQPKRAVETLEAAASRAQQPYRDQFRREAAQKASDSADFTTARRLLDTLLAGDPFNGDLLAAKAETFAREGDNAALTAFYAAQLAQIQAASLPADQKTQRMASLRRGYIGALVTAKQFDAALDQYQTLLNGYSEDEGLAREVARFAESNRLADRLTKYYQKATADSPRDYRWPLVLARLNTALRRYPEAVAAFDKAVYVRPDRADLFIAKVDLETRLLRFDDALKTYQRLYDLSYHDSQYLAAQASLHARLGHNSEAVRLLKAAYVDAHPKELNGYVAAMEQLTGWRMYAEVDQIFQQAKPFLAADNGDFRRFATLEGRALVALRHPVDALETMSAVRRATSDPKNPWVMQPQIDAMGAVIDDLYTPEEKTAFAAKLPSGFNEYDVARACGFAELTAKRLYGNAILWRNLELLQSARLRNAELGQQLETTAPAVSTQQADAVSAAALAAYARAGDSEDEIRLFESRLASGAGFIDPARYARLLVEAGVDLPERLRRVSALNAIAANQLVQELVVTLPAEKARAVVAARGASISGIWTHAYAALTGLYFATRDAARDFDATLGPRTVGAELSAAKSDALRGSVWYYYAARYSDYSPAAADLRLATVEASPIASNSYVAIGAYEQALELSPGRADVHLLLAERDKAGRIGHLHTAFELLAKNRVSPEYYETAKKALTLMNQYGAATELRPDADAMLAVNIKHNQGYEFMAFVEGILAHAADRKAAIGWVLQLARNPVLSGLAEQLTESALLTEPEKDAFYQANIGATQARIAYANYLNRQGRFQDAWRVVNQIEPKAERPAALLLELAATTGRLTEVFGQYDAGTLAAPASEQMLTVASRLARADLALQIREYEYQRELQTGNASASAYLGLAQVRIEQKRSGEALALLRDVTLGVGAPFENLGPAVTLLEKAGLEKKAAEYAREWRTAEPWNAEAILAFGRLAADKALLESLRKSDRTPYSLRAQAAGALRDLRGAMTGATELDLLTQQTISPQEAAQPFFALARLRAAQLTPDAATRVRLYLEAIALKPSLREQRLALAEAAFLSKQDSLGLTAWRSYDSPAPAIGWLHSSPLDAAVGTEADRIVRVEELAAAALTRRRQYAAAEALYGRMPHFEKLRDEAAAAGRLEQLNRGRAPAITNELTQAAIVKPKLAGGAE